MRRTRVKICCIASAEEAALAVACGADALGLVGAMPSGPGPIDDRLIAEIAVRVPPPVATVLLTSETEAAAIIDHARRCRVGTLQLVDRVAPEAHEAIHRALPAVRRMQVVHVGGGDALQDSLALAPFIDALLLDSGRPAAAVRELGGTGRTHDWAVSRAIVARAPCPVILAGGLHAANVGAAIAAVRPFAVDVCTGVRSNGRLDRGRLEAFMAAVAAAPPPT